MEIGTYADGRAVTYNEATHEFGIEGIRTTAQLLVRYDNAGQIAWSTDQMRAWVQGCAESDAAAEQVAADFGGASSSAAYAPGPAAGYATGAAGYATGAGSGVAGYSAAVGPGAAAGSAPRAFDAATFEYSDAGMPDYNSRYGLAKPDERVSPSTTNVLGRRYVAFFIDSMIAWFGVGLFAIAFGVIVAIVSHGNRAALSSMTLLLQLLAYLLFFAYFVVGEAKWGTTFGKRMFGLHVLRTDGGRISLVQAFLRNIMLLVDTLFFTLPALLSARSSDLHQRLGDRVAETVVVFQG